MKLRVSEKSKKKREIEYRVYVEADGDKGVDVIATDDEGVDWYILKIQSNGKFSRHVAISSDAGFQVTKGGRIKEEK